jgi:hypothetical protein
MLYKLTGGLFDKTIMDAIMKLEFFHRTPTTFLNTAEQGISLPICQLYLGNEKSENQSKK